jgi:hypothetical protein
VKQVQDENIEAGNPVNNDCGWNNTPLLGLFLQYTNLRYVFTRQEAKAHSVAWQE